MNQGNLAIQLWKTITLLDVCTFILEEVTGQQEYLTANCVIFCKASTDNNHSYIYMLILVVIVARGPARIYISGTNSF